MAGTQLIVLNGSVHTIDPQRPVAEAIAVDGETISAIGANAEIRALAGPQTKIIDAGGGTVLPGFNDAHVHFLAGGFSLSNVDLRESSSPREMALRLGEYARKAPKGTWILGGDWDHENWEGGALPNRNWIDSLTPEHPVLVTRLDGHMALANSLALHLAGITCSTVDPPGGVIVRDSKSGEPVGILKDSAQTLVERCIPPKTFEQKHAAAIAATDHAAALGVTSVTDVSTDDDLDIYLRLLNDGKLKTRIYAARSITCWEKLIQTQLPKTADGLLRTGILKGFSDGSLGSSTALFFEPYADDPGNRGLLFEQMFPEGIMKQRVAAADKLGFQVMIHAIGDEANLRILDVYDEVAALNGPRDRRFRIEHAQHLRPGEIPRFARQRVIASMQPYHAADDGRWCEKRLGAPRCKGAYPFRSLLDSGATLAFGSDWTVAPLNPLQGIKAAVTRQTLDGRYPAGWIPEQKITLDEAIDAYTRGSAYAEFSETTKGTLSVGKLADLIVLDRNLHRTDPNDIDKARVEYTILNGKVIHGSG
ncbi:MAG TPA: amidohydrolase [Verrucomicrobiae bacterium]|nr:amidohydrolase [Verrucomicrobiae bacterium]